MSNRLYIIGAGHGEETAGKRSPGKRSPDDGKLGVMEYEFNRDIAKRIEKALKVLDIPTHIICQDDSNISLGDRVRIVNTMVEEWQGNALYISVHGNAAGKGGWSSARGFRVFRHDSQEDFEEQEQFFADRICEHVKSWVPAWEHKTRILEKGFYVIKKAVKCPALLTENGFMTNEPDAAFMDSDDGRDRIAAYHVGAILDHEERYN